MHPILKSALRFALGAVILLVGVVIMNGLISLKKELPVSDRRTPARAVRVLPVEIASRVPLIPIEGRVEARYRADILAEVTGTLQLGGKEFREGTAFQQGETMMQLDNREARLNLISQRSQFLQLLSSQLADLHADFPESGGGWTAFSDSMDVENTLPILPPAGSDRERLFVANRGLLSSYHAIRSAEERLSKYAILAPFDGVVAATTVQPGGLVRAGQLAGSLIGKNDFEVKTALHVRYLSTVQRGDTVLYQDENGQTIGVAKVHRISGMVDPSTQTATVYCRSFSTNANRSKLRDGQFVSGVIQSEVIEDVMVVPNAWIQTGQRIFVVQDDRLVAKSVDVVFSSRSESMIQGLDGTDWLLGEVLTTAFEGMPVAPQTGE
ncbi:MAG: HlyD family efflux transporter periplasmic adaptor subunit [Flavobacteriales bacterium]|nr:HlyD family efflux transporter periplasmic adaptor subunit [Flavobacteriales bacterium]